MSELIYGAYGGGWDENPLNLVDRVKHLGFDMIEIGVGDDPTLDLKKVRAKAEEAGLKIITCTGCPRDKDPIDEEERIRKRGIVYLKQCVEAAAALGADCLAGLTYSSVGRRLGSRPMEQYWEWGSTALKQVARHAQKFGITVAFETVNRYETILNNTVDQALRFREMVGEPNFMIHLDTFHLNMEEESLYQATKKALPYTCHYHFAEGNRGRIGKGSVDWEGVYRALSEGRYHGTVTLEAFVNMNPEIAAKLSMWRKIGESTDRNLQEGLKYLKGLEAKYYG